ncbi:TIR domain-containing protein [Leptospira sp. WS39.C2]
MAKKKIIVSFDFENDKAYKLVLNMWNANPNFEFEFADLTPDEIKSNDISRIKAALTAKINKSSYTLVIVGQNANSVHKDSKLIGYKNWINFEIAKSKEKGNKIVAVKLNKANQSPDELLNSGASWAMSFTQESILKALEDVQ